MKLVPYCGLFLLVTLSIGSVVADRADYATWRKRTPFGDQPPEVNKPAVVGLDDDLILQTGGVRDDCLEGTTNFTYVYLYNKASNYGRYLDLEGTPPDDALFRHVWNYADSDRSFLLGGGVYYTNTFNPLIFMSYSPLYKFTLSFTQTKGRWSKVFPNGKVPSIRAEATLVRDLNNPELTYFYGGVDVGATGLNVHDDLYVYNGNTNYFELLYNGSTYVGVKPTKRYHATGFWTDSNGEPELEFIQGVFSPGGGFGSQVELFDAWRFNLNTLRWRQINSTMGVTRRHGAFFQTKAFGHHIACHASGDTSHPNELPTLGCQFAIVTLNDTVCKISIGDGNTNWEPIRTVGFRDNLKYTGYHYDQKRNKLYTISGTHEVLGPYGNYTLQVWNRGIQTLDFDEFL